MNLLDLIFGSNSRSDITDISKVPEVTTGLNESAFPASATGVVGEIGNPGFGLGDLSGFEGNFIGDSFYDTGGVFGRPYGSPGLLEVEKSYIMHQRAVSLYPEVAIGIEEIMRDLFVKDDPMVLEIDGDPESNSNFDLIKELFDNFSAKPFTVMGGARTPDSLIIFNFLKQAYVDGRIAVLSISVDPEQLKAQTTSSLHGMRGSILNESLVHWNKRVKFIDINNLNENQLTILLESDSSKEQINPKSKKGKKLEPDTETQDKSNHIRIFIPIDPVKINEQDGKIFYQVTRGNKIELDEGQLIQSDFGLFDVVGARHGFLLYAFKYANQLQSLQDMLIPMRFKRSIARRVFNVDVSSVPQNRAIAYMQDISQKFKYKKHYDASSGKIISKTNEPTGIVEDYWFANRSGNKGTTVETIDEAGSFQDGLEDIMYFNKKLYQSMFIPLRRIFESDASYDYTSNSIEVDELRFVNFLERVRFVYNATLTQMFQIILKDKGLSDEDTQAVSVRLKYEAWYEKAKVKEDFTNALDLYEAAKPYIGKLFSAETIIQRVFDMSPSDIKDEFEKVKGEIEQDSPFYPIYQANDSEDSGY